MKRDLTYQENTYLNWKEKVKDYRIKELSKINSKLVIDFIFDMELGFNVSKKNKKGGRSYGRLNVLKNKLIQTIKMFEDRGIKDITKLNEKEAHLFFHELYIGEIKRQDGEVYTYPIDFVRNFKVFYHWWIKVNRKKGIIVEDILEDIELKKPVINFVYIKKEQVDDILPYFNKGEQLLIKFLFDSIIRFPTECLSLKRKDVYEKDGEVWINIPDEVSKTFGRTFNLLYCGEALLKYIKKNELEEDDYLFPVIKNHNQVYDFNCKLKKVCKKVLGDVVSHPKARGKFSEISGYDFRHSGSIHLRVLAQKNNSISLDAIRQRGGWSDFKMLNYYTQLIGLDGEIKKEALLIEEDRSRLEKEVENQKELLKIQNERIRLNAEQTSIWLKKVSLIEERMKKHR